jgi:hypothetical protein
MSNKKTEFDNKGISSKFISDNGNSYLSKYVFRGDYKGPEERKAVRAKSYLSSHYVPSKSPDKQYLGKS